MLRRAARIRKGRSAGKDTLCRQGRPQVKCFRLKRAPRPPALPDYAEAEKYGKAMTTEAGDRDKTFRDSPWEKRRREMLIYLGISIAAVELFILAGGFCYGLIASWGR
jgi:hypothetical protein